MSIRNYQMKDQSISVDQDRYATSIVAKYFDNATVKASTKFYKITLPYEIIFNKADTFTSDKQVEKFNRSLYVHYRYCINLLIYLSSRRVDFIFSKSW